MTPEQFDTLLQARDDARDAHESYCDSVNEDGEWCDVTYRQAQRLYAAYTDLQAQIDNELDYEREHSDDPSNNYHATTDQNFEP